MKKVIYKGKEKEIPICNPDLKKCEFYSFKKQKYCQFDKYKDTEFCIYHSNKEEDFLICPYDSNHKILKEKFNSHLKVCNTLLKNQEMKKKEWYKENINLMPVNVDTDLVDIKWENLDLIEYGNTLDIIVNTYNSLKLKYKEYILSNRLDLFLQNQINDDKYKYYFSALNFNENKDLDSTMKFIHSTKHSFQNDSLSNLILKIIPEKDINNFLIIEFGAGKGGLSNAVNKNYSNKCKNILLEKESSKHKKDNKNDNMLRYKTDIANFDINYLSKIYDNKCIFGIAKHICGCAFDLSMNCLLNINNISLFKGLCMASCCHHLCKINLINDIDQFLQNTKMNLRQITLLFKATSWLFSMKEDNNKEKSKDEFKNLFISRNINRKYIGLISKYIIDLCRCLFLIKKGFIVLYLKYCSNEYTSENNLILAFKN